jgi:septal ring factor EnvC (AmiA/AmiB activator)
VAAVAVVVLVTAGLTYALVSTRQDLARTSRTLSATRTDLTGAQDELSATRTTLDRTEKTLTDTKAELTEARDQIGSIKSQLADARNDAEQEKTRGDQAVEAAADLRQCLNNVLVNANAVQNGDYASMTWDDAMYTQCQQAIAEGDAMAEAPSTTTTT